jgi:hypothetical protein
MCVGADCEKILVKYKYEKILDANSNHKGLTTLKHPPHPTNP